MPINGLSLSTKRDKKASLMIISHLKGNSEQTSWTNVFQSQPKNNRAASFQM